MKISIIGGGNIGSAMARGMSSGKAVNAADIWVTDKNEASLERIGNYNPNIRTGTDNTEAIAWGDIVILAVKPWLLESVIHEVREFLDYKNQTLVSVAAGVDFNTMDSLLERGDHDKPALYRIIPNTAIAFGESVTFIAGRRPSAFATQQLLRIFGELGQAVEVDERLLSAGTSLASSGIAFALRYIDDSIRGGEEMGFSTQEARTIVMHTVRGALALLRANGSMPRDEINKVTTPNGCTLKGLHAMDEAGFTEAVLNGLRKSKI